MSLIYATLAMFSRRGFFILKFVKITQLIIKNSNFYLFFDLSEAVKIEQNKNLKIVLGKT